MSVLGTELSIRHLVGGAKISQHRLDLGYIYGLIKKIVSRALFQRGRHFVALCSQGSGCWHMRGGGHSGG